MKRLLTVMSIVTIALALVFAALPASALSPTPVFVSSWGGPGTAEGQFSIPQGVTVDRFGTVYVPDTNRQRIQIFAADGTFQLMWGWGVDTGASQLETCTSSCQGGIVGSGDGQFNSPTGIAVDEFGNVYVADQGNNRVQVFDGFGNFLRKFGSAGTGAGNMMSPTGIALDASDDVYVTDYGNQRLDKFDATGNFLMTWGWGVATGTSAFETCTSSCQMGIAGSGSGQFLNPNGVAIDADGTVYVSSYGGHYVQKFTSSGTPGLKWGTFGTGDGELKYPTGLAVDASGNIFVADSQNHRIVKFAPDGSFLTSWGGYGTSDGLMQQPNAVALDGAGLIYEADTSNNRIQVFGPPDVSLSLRAPSRVAAGTRVRIRGELTSTDLGCQSGRTLQLKRGSKVLATKVTNGAGAYRFGLRILRTLTVRVVFDGGTDCASMAAMKTIAVRS